VQVALGLRDDGLDLIELREGEEDRTQIPERFTEAAGLRVRREREWRCGDRHARQQATVDSTNGEPRVFERLCGYARAGSRQD
jgi:hypothetical protein